MIKDLIQSAKILIALMSVITLPTLNTYAADSISDAPSEDRYLGREVTLHELNTIVNKFPTAIHQSRTLQRRVLVEWVNGMLTYDVHSSPDIVHSSGKPKADYRSVDIRRLWSLLRPYENKLQHPSPTQTFETFVSEDEDSYFDQKLRVINGYDTMILTQLKVAQYFEVLGFARMVGKNACMFADGDKVVPPTFPRKVIDFIIKESDLGNPHADVILGTLCGVTVKVDDGVEYRPDADSIKKFYALAGTDGYGRGYHLLGQHFLEHKAHHLKTMTEVQIYRLGLKNLKKALRLGYAYALPDFGEAVIAIPSGVKEQFKFESIYKTIDQCETEFATRGYQPTVEDVYPANGWGKEKIR